MDVDGLHSVAVFVEDGFEHVPDEPVGLGLHANALLVWQVHAEQHPTFYRHLLRAQAWYVLIQV